ncbi:GTPase-associated system all-helical protein GASH [Phyllobacterium sp. UNC302MFCol5.2]|uniref:GTPase-associated system all-helical protein GASH n=1 Tax=Phyllobacterium sp. UNC302MFCol5.2 TaxID=1449065 RepID=UPI000484F04E|nr:GTPase-associated system all-helical protein GASH [Phyllobacterium sp. UNC302MFCol5.2]
MDNLSVHMRITSLTPTNEDVDARRATITKLSANWGKITDINKILNKAEMIADSLGGDGQPIEELGLEVQEALQKHASAFLYIESPLDVGVCAGNAALSILAAAPGTGGWTTTDVYSNALWSALAFQPALTEVRREKLRREVLDLAQKRSRLAAEKARERTPVPDLGNLAVVIEEGAEPTTTFKAATSATIEALRRNAALDREELDFLWWVQVNRSRLLDRAFVGMAEPLRLLACGVEAASHLRRLPADLHRDLVLRTVGEDPELDLKELLEVIGEDRQLLAASFDSSRVARHSSIFPLLHALATGEVDTAGADEKRKASIWASRALLEAGLSRVCDTGVVNL